MRSLIVCSSLFVLLAGCWSGSLAGNGDGGGTEIQPPPPLTFNLRNDGASSLYIYQSCNPDMTITELSDPPREIGYAYGCGICDCAVSVCPSVVCGPCFVGAQEIAGGATFQWSWSPVDMTYETRADTTMCTHTRVLPAGQYRLDVRVYAAMADAVARNGAGLVTQIFTLPPDAERQIFVPIAAPP